MGRMLSGLIIIALLASNVSSVAGNKQSQQISVIASWNILGVDPIPQNRIVNIAQVIRQINPDLIVLSEVNPNNVPEKIVQELGSEYQQPIILTQKETVVQNIAFIFKNSVSVSGAQLINETDLSEEPRSRKALTANVRIGSFDFILIGVHLKSSRDSASRAKRTRQCRAIANFISQSVAEDERDVLVIGDYNMIPRTGDHPNDEVNFIAMSPTNFLRFISSDFLTGQTSHIDSCNPLKGNLLDGFAISRLFTKEYIPGSTRLISFQQLGISCNAFLNGISDHRPLVSEFSVTTDDD